MTRALFPQAISKFILGVVVTGILIFLPAGTFHYWNAWLFMGILFIPMFFAGIVMMFLSVPLVFGSILSFAVFLAYPVIIAKRIRSEETMLEKGLEGYSEYRQKVKYKIIPFVW